MKKYILLMLLISCQEEETLKRRNPFMTISNAIPVQFWVNGVETFNEKQICGVEPVCFCQPFNCDDEIRIQFQDTYNNFYLNILDSDSNELFSLLFDDVFTNTWQASFTPSNLNICDEKIQLQIVTPDPTLSALSTFTNAGSGSAWVTGANPSKTFNTVFGQTQYLVSSFGTISGETYQFNYDIDLSGVSNLDAFAIYILDSSYNSLGSYTIADALSSNGNITGTATITPSANGYYVGFRFSIGDAGSNVTIDINSVSYTAQADYIWAKSDCLDIKTSHDCTELIQYTNADDFNNIVYQTSPASEYSLRIPAQFWKEDNPMEQEDSELSNGVIKTRRQTITQKRYLEIGYMPNYMHLKTQLALMHDTVTIDGSQWKKRDAYESEPIKRYPLKRANVWLTLYNSIDDNIL